MSRWHYPLPKTKEEREGGLMNHWGPYPDGANDALCDEFYGHIDTNEAKYIDPETMFCK